MDTVMGARLKWTPEQDAILTEMWNASIAGVTIAAWLGITRSSAFNRVYALGLERRKIIRRVKRDKSAVPPSPPEPAEVPKEEPARVTYPRAPIVYAAPDGSPYVTLMDLTGCKWPMNDGGPFLFCNEARADRGNYCDVHSRASRPS